MSEPYHSDERLRATLTAMAERWKSPIPPVGDDLSELATMRATLNCCADDLLAVLRASAPPASDERSQPDVGARG